MDLDSWIEPASVDFRVTKNAAAASSVTTGTWVATADHPPAKEHNSAMEHIMELSSATVSKNFSPSTVIQVRS
jgi:hypothetical protein